MKKVEVVVCAGTTCYLMGAATLQSLEDHLEPEIRKMVEVKGSRCLGQCKNDRYGDAPYVSVNGEVMSVPSLSFLLDKVRSLAAGG